MAELGRYNTLKVTDIAPHGVYLDDDDQDPILLPTKQVPEGTKIGDELTVFIYLDSEDRWIATLQKPKVQVGQVAYLTVVDVNQIGAFLDWGMVKDLLVPYAEQKQKLEVGQSYLVYVTLDNTGRLIGSTRLNRFLKDDINSPWGENNAPFEQGDRVSLIISHRTELGYKAVINHEFWGVLHNDDIRKAIRPGHKLDGYIKRIRDDKRIDLSLEPLGYEKTQSLRKRILKKLHDSNGSLPLNDYSPADLIELHFGVSKRAFKMAIGSLFKDRHIVIEENGIRLSSDDDRHALNREQKPKPRTNNAAAKTDAPEETAAAEVAQRPRKHYNARPKTGRTLSLKTQSKSS